MKQTGSTATRQIRRSLLAAVVAAGLLVTSPTFADSPNKGRVSFSIGSDITTAYFFRGILQERNGFIWQPYGEVDLNVFTTEEKDPDPIKSFTLFAGSWNSVNSKQTLSSGNGPGNWYESDFYAGMKALFFGNTEGKAWYIGYSYPGGAFHTVQEMDFQVSFNDAEWLGKWALNPYTLMAGEFDNTALGTKEGVYSETGIRPNFTLIDSETYPLSMAVPLKVGLSVTDYYEGANGNNYTFGYFQGGPVFTVPLAFIPSEYGSWAASAGVQTYAFGTSTQAANKGNNPWVVGTWSLTFAY
jgi:hypothetical protein